MKILYCSDILNVHDRYLLEGFGSSGHEIAVATFFHRSEQLPSFVSPFKVFRHTFSTYPDGTRASESRIVRWFRYRTEERKAIAVMSSWLNEWKPDVTFASWAITSGYVAAKAGAHPLVLYPWGSDVLLLPEQRAWYRQRAVTALRSASMWACNARHTADRARELSGATPRIEVLPCELDGGVFSPEKADRSTFEKLWPGRKVVMTTRPLKELYDHEAILRAMQKVDAALYVTGEGPLRERLTALAGTGAHFAGWVADDQLPPLLAACDVFVTASRSDSASTAVFEAMACARPVVASDIPANREWIQDRRTGRLFRTGDSEDLARVLSEVLSNPGTLGAQARQSVLEKADRRTNIPKLLAAMESLR